MTVVLVLGGTAEARDCAAALLRRGFDVVSSLAGRVTEPKLPDGEVRIGGFGGPAGLAKWLLEQQVAAVVDATHPFAQRIGTSAVTGCTNAGVPLLRLRRPGWHPGDGDNWHWVDSLEQAAARVPQLGTRAFVTTGRQGLAAFASSHRTWFLIRCVDRPRHPLPPHSEVLLSRGPYRLDDERDLFARHRIDVLVTKDSGGTMTAAKLAAARELDVPVIVVRRPPRPATDTVDSPGAAVRWVTEVAEREGMR